MASSAEKIRYERLKLVSQKALDQSIKKGLSIDQIKKCYPIISSSSDGVRLLEMARSQIIDFWQSKSLEEFALIFKERNLASKLDELDEIVEAAHRRQYDGDTRIPIDLLTPDELIDASLVSTRKQSADTLSIIYNQLCADNQELHDELMSLAKEGNDIKNDINALIASLGRDIEAMKEDAKVDDLANALTNEY
ncbi:hypothetical protein QFC19_009063 [Naganishia cerealis]|uniref:Uncharacterized protein n=1 Tax=Naganishia cerealis TaxID=610337 RepID=A0ACC2UXE4_9TREE|nr:hypothetical protein QFC19_009063 [Naganishia cerealis]